MGRPYESELSQLAGTFRFALSLDTAPLEAKLKALARSPLTSIGSGGSQSTAQLISDLHELRFGQVARADTPLIARRYLCGLKSSTVVLVSARGKNPDILGIAREAIESEPTSIIALCSSRNSPLAQIVNSYAKGFAFEFDLPGGKDGFLATNSLLALNIVSLKAYGNPPLSALHRLFTSTALRTLSKPFRSKEAFFDCKQLIVLSGAGGRSPATDLESKLVEAGLVAVQLSDYRNFAHGRHHWIAKNPSTAVLALAAHDEIPIASRTLELLPSTIPKHLITTPYEAPSSWLALQAGAFAVVSEYGKARGIDPGRPGVPLFGRRVYHFNAFRRNRLSDELIAIRRKLKASPSIDHPFANDLAPAYVRASSRLENAKFQGLILDYDGTVCDSADRFGAIPRATVDALRRVPASGFLLGVATGRGKSVRQALQLALPKRYWKNIWIGYYNGGSIAQLDDVSQPSTTGAVEPQLQEAASVLRNVKIPGLELSIRPQQITVEISSPFDISQLWSIVFGHLQQSRLEGLKVVMSTRSVDIIPMATSKLALLETLSRVRPNSKFLCIGDMPRWPGNDAELLGHEFSLSVDEVDVTPGSVWNLAPAGVVGSAALRYYLDHITFHSGYFRLRLSRK